MTLIDYKPGKLVTFRDREWIVLPSSDPELLMLKPIGGSDDEITGVFLPLEMPGDAISDASFPEPDRDDLDDFQSARMLYDATRLLFRNASGPFRCIGKLGFRPRSYQIVPLVMALKQETVRLMIADDVGIGKTIEALMILREMLERGDIRNFAVICLPHLCEQWQQELKDKLDIQAEIIRTSTAASLDRRLPDDRSVFHHIPYQVISIDYIKSDSRMGIFLNDCPGLVIVDEVHTCAKPAGATSNAQQQRYRLLHEIARKESQHLVLLTATPHSGKDEEFQSLLGLLNGEFKTYALDQIDQAKRRRIARHFIQRKRENIKRWLRNSASETTPFPERDPKELAYHLSENYAHFYQDILEFARGISKDGAKRGSSKIRYWAALALLRGVMSSPAAAMEMLRNRQQRMLDQDDREALAQSDSQNPLIETLSDENDTGNAELIDNAELSASEIRRLSVLSEQAAQLSGIGHDWKAKQAVTVIRKWLDERFNPIVFCRYIATANYIGALLRESLSDKVDVQIITSELADEQRREKIELMDGCSQRVLVATDCLSEGINLQHLFTAVLHYDLPWNPNRIEQREGRVDRFGQEAEIVKTLLLWGEDNPIDRIVLKILIRKVREIQKATGVSITLGDDKTSIMDAVIKDVLLETQTKAKDGRQMSLFAEDLFTHELEDARKKAENLRSIFAHESIDPELVNQSLDEIDEAIGDPGTVESLVLAAVAHLGGSVSKNGSGYLLNLLNLPEHLKIHFSSTGSKPVRVSFESPTPAGYRYIGRNHLFVEQLCQFLLSLAFEPRPPYKRIARASVIRTAKVGLKTTLIQFRVRNVIREVSGKQEVISEEMCLWGYRGSGVEAKILSGDEAKDLLHEAVSTSGLSLQMQQEVFESERSLFRAMTPHFMDEAEKRAENLVEAHGRFKELVGGRRYEAVHPVLPPDIMGVYILNPVPESLF
ncbi:helicase-related protein [Chlorobium limicola]